MMLQKHRTQSQLNARLLAETLHGGADKLDKFAAFFQECERVGVKPVPTVNEMSRVQIYEAMYETTERMKLVKGLDLMSASVPYYMFVNNVQVRGSVGLIMALHLIKVLGTEEQIRNWAVPIAKLDWASCYVQTELSHGSDVQNLKTLAVYDHKTKEFVLHNPDIDSIKWWPGDLGMSATHGIIMTRIVSNGKDFGVYPLFIQLRDLKTHKQLPGIEIGDIGPKLGYASKDNGYLKFTHHRVPGNALLGKFYQMDEEGNLKIIGNPKIIYASMMETREMLLAFHTYATFRMLTIATRYSVLRTQFKDEQNQEIPIIDYQLQRSKLLKFLSRAYAMALSKLQLNDFLKKNLEAVKKGNFDYLHESHINLCSYKSYFTTTGVQGTTEIIQATGGHGFSHFSGLPAQLLEIFPDTILEGENSLLQLQIARHLLKSFQLLNEGKAEKIKGSTKYIKDEEALEQFKLDSEPENLFKHENLLRLIAKTSVSHIKDTGLLMMSHIQSSGLDPKAVWDKKMGSRLTLLGLLHTLHTVGFEAYTRARSIPETTEDSKLLKSLCFDLLLYYLIEVIEEQGICFVRSGGITPAQIALLREKREHLIEKLSPHLLKLSEGFQIPEIGLWSAIADNNGKPYENLLAWAKQYGSLNKYAQNGHPATHQYKL